MGDASAFRSDLTIQTSARNDIFRKVEILFKLGTKPELLALLVYVGKRILCEHSLAHRFEFIGYMFIDIYKERYDAFLTKIYKFHFISHSN